MVSDEGFEVAKKIRELAHNGGSLSDVGEALDDFFAAKIAKLFTNNELSIKLKPTEAPNAD